MNCTICRRPTDDRDPIRHQHCADRLRTNLTDIPGLRAYIERVQRLATSNGN